jgi:hypothetical protein
MTVTLDPQTHEPILADFSDRPASWGSFAERWRRSKSLSWRAQMGPLKPLWATRPGTPIRAFAIGIATGFLFAWISLDVEDPRKLTLLFLGWLAVAVLLAALEVSNTRAYLTPTRLVWRYGITGRGRRELPLTDVHRVEVDYSGLWPAGEELDLGDLVVHGRGRRVVIANVRDPEQAARRIMEARTAVVERAF